ncbi:MAG TPA: hypothetical protein VFV85_09045, partial [Conexibacter sp.]|nr:hypothetical protein [Conexibacter sp.]
QMTRCLSQRFVEGPGEPAAAPPPPPANGTATATATRPAPPRTAPRPAPPPVHEERPLKAGALVWAVLRERIAALFGRGDRGAA